MSDKRETGAFDERAALDELERLRQQIARERARRRQVSDEFDAFTRSFKAPAGRSAEPEAPAAPPTAAAPGGTPVQNRPALETATRSAHRETPARIDAPRIEPPRAPKVDIPPPPVLPVDPHAVFPTEIDTEAPASPRRRRLAVVMLVTLALAVIAAWVLWPSGPAAPGERVGDRTAPAPAPPTAESTPASPPAGDTAASPPAPAARVTELTTTRNVWVRVIADGERVLERELPAGSRIPITAQDTIVIRTGDAGAVSLTIAGEDQGPLGREGQVVTRTFTVRGG